MDAILDNIQINFNSLISEMNEQQYDKIRFASYRTANKVRFIQKKTSFYLIDLYNTIEILRENNLHKIQDIHSEMTVHQLYQIAQSLFLDLNKRLPRSQNVDITSSITNLLSFMIYANDVNQSGKINILFVKIVFCTLSSGRFQDKLKYIFSQLIDPNNGNIMMIKFCAFLKSLLQLCCTVNESQFYTYEEQVAKTIFQTILSPSLDIKAFNRLFYASNGPPSILSWFVIYHKMAQVEFIIHPTICNACSTANFTGFRYRCIKCYNLNLCQNCFWTGKSTGTHNSETHSCKEYISYKSTGKQLSNSLKRSFRLKSSSKNKIELNDDYLTKMNNDNLEQNYYDTVCSPFNQSDFDDTMSNLTYNTGSINETNQFEIIEPNEQLYYVQGNNTEIVTSSPQYIIIEQQNQQQQNNTWPLRQQHVNYLPANLEFHLDDEHRLIAQYAASLANSNSLQSIIVESIDEYGNPVQHSITIDSHLDDHLNDGTLNDQLAECALAYEYKNRELMNEILRLRDLSPSSDYNSLVNSNSQNIRSLSRFSNSPVLSIKSQQDVVAIEELCYLRERKTELENHLQNLLMSKEELKNQLNQTIKVSQNLQNLCSTPISSANSTLTKKEATKFKKDLNSLQKTAKERDKMFQETQELLKEEIYQKSVQSHQDELNEEINKVQKEQEEKELLEDFDRLSMLNQIENQLICEVKQNQLKQNGTNNLNVNNNNDETTSDDSVTLHDDVQNKNLSNQGNLHNEKNKINNLNQQQQCQNKIEIKLNNISGTFDNEIDNYNNNNNNNEKTNDIELNEETMHINIMNRNIDLLLKQNNKQQQQQKSNRINKYESIYGKLKNNDKSSNISNINSNLNSQIKDNRLFNQNNLNENDKLINRSKETSQLDIKKNLDAKRALLSRLSAENSIDEISETNNSISSNSTYLYKFDVKSQPLMQFSSIAYVNANRISSNNNQNLNNLTNLNKNSTTSSLLTNQNTRQMNSLNKLMNLGSSNTSSNDLPIYKLGDSLDDSSLNTDRIQLQEDICNLSISSSTTDNELRENTDSINSSDTLVDDLNIGSFDNY